MQARPARSAFARPGTLKRGWSPATPPARRARDENRAPATLVDAAHARLRTRVRFPPSPPLKAPLRRGFRVRARSRPRRRNRHREGGRRDQPPRKVCPAAARTVSAPDESRVSRPAGGDWPEISREPRPRTSTLRFGDGVAAGIPASRMSRTILVALAAASLLGGTATAR